MTVDADNLRPDEAPLRDTKRDVHEVMEATYEWIRQQVGERTRPTTKSAEVLIGLMKAALVRWEYEKGGQAVTTFTNDEFRAFARSVTGTYANSPAKSIWGSWRERDSVINWPRQAEEHTFEPRKGWSVTVQLLTKPARKAFRIVEVCRDGKTHILSSTDTIPDDSRYHLKPLSRATNEVDVLEYVDEGVLAGLLLNLRRGELPDRKIDQIMAGIGRLAKSRAVLILLAMLSIQVLGLLFGVNPAAAAWRAIQQVPQLFERLRTGELDPEQGVLYESPDRREAFLWTGEEEWRQELVTADSAADTLTRQVAFHETEVKNVSNVLGIAAVQNDTQVMVSHIAWTGNLRPKTGDRVDQVTREEVRGFPLTILLHDQPVPSTPTVARTDIFVDGVLVGTATTQSVLIAVPYEELHEHGFGLEATTETEHLEAQIVDQELRLTATALPR